MFSQQYNFSFNPGDVVTLFPKNLPEEVDQFLELLNLSDIADDAFTLLPNDEGMLSQEILIPPNSKR